MKTCTPPIGRAGCLLSRIWTSPVPPPSICVSLMHKAVISQMHQPLRKVSLGIMAYLKGIKNVLDRLAASLIPRSRSSHRAVLYARASVKCTHNIFPGSRGHVVHCVPVDVWHCGCFSAHFCFFYTDRAVILKKKSFRRALSRTSYHGTSVSELHGFFWWWQLSTRKVLAIPRGGAAHLLLANVQSF